MVVGDPARAGVPAPRHHGQDEELRDYARFAPPQLMHRDPELQTEGRFDPAKYQRFLAQPAGAPGRPAGRARAVLPHRDPEGEAVRADRRRRLRHRRRSVARLAGRERQRAGELRRVPAAADGRRFERDRDARLARSTTTRTRRSSSARPRVAVRARTIPRVVTAADSAAVRARVDGAARGDRRAARSSRTSPSASRRTRCRARTAAISARDRAAASSRSSRRRRSRSSRASSRSPC